MDKQEKIKIAITAGIASVILLIFVLVLALNTGKSTGSDDEKLSENIAAYTDSAALSSADDALIKSEDETQKNSEDASKEDEKKDASANASSDDKDKSSEIVLTTPQNKDTSAKSVSGNSFYSASQAVLKNNYKGMKVDVPKQLKEMLSYWAEGNTEAVRDLAHLARFEAMSYALSGSNDFYYYGDTGSDGSPDGYGLAVYGGDQYYYGHWSNGVRSGEGTWISFYPDYSNYVVTEHMYSGGWSDDLPSGQGQEHYDYNFDLMNSDDVYLQNAIGSFVKGMYDGQMYIITVDSDEDTTEWVGKCDNGSWEQVSYASLGKNNKIPVLSEREDSEHHLYMSGEGAKNNGVRGIITGGKKK